MNRFTRAENATAGQGNRFTRAENAAAGQENRFTRAEIATTGQGNRFTRAENATAGRGNRFTRAENATAGRGNRFTQREIYTALNKLYVQSVNSVSRFQKPRPARLPTKLGSVSQRLGSFLAATLLGRARGRPKSSRLRFEGG